MRHVGISLGQALFSEGGTASGYWSTYKPGAVTKDRLSEGMRLYLEPSHRGKLTSQMPR